MNISHEFSVNENTVIMQDQIDENNNKFNNIKIEYEKLGELTNGQNDILETLNKLRAQFCDNKQKYYEYINDNDESVSVDIYKTFNRKYQNNIDNLPIKEQISEIDEKWNYIKNTYWLLKNDNI